MTTEPDYSCESFEYLALKDHPSATGVPLGGVGVGCFQFTPDGSFRRMCLNNTSSDFLRNTEGFFFALWRPSGARVLKRTVTPVHGMPGFAHSWYTGLLPYARLGLGDGVAEDGVSVEAWSGLVPHNVKDSSLPLVFLEVTVENASEVDEEVAVALSWQDVIGRGIKDVETLDSIPSDGKIKDYWLLNPETAWPFREKVGTSVESFETGSWAGFRQFTRESMKPRRATYQNYNAEVVVCAEVEGGDRMTCLPDWTEESGERVWRAFRSKGEFDGQGFAERELSRAESPLGSASALALKTVIPAGGKRKFVFLVSWFMPELDFSGQGDPRARFGKSDYHRYYHNFFSSIEELITYGAAEKNRLYAQSREWQQPLIESTLPSWLIFKIINSGYPLYSLSILNKAGQFSVMEGGMGGLSGTMDQRISSHPFCQKFFTRLDRAEMRLFADSQHEQGNILHFCGHYYIGIVDVDGNTFIGNEWMLDNSCGWVLQLAKDYQQTGEIEILRRDYARVKACIQFVHSRIDNPYHIPNGPTTYDDGSHPPVFCYSGSIYLCGLYGAMQIAKAMEDKDFYEFCAEQVQLTRKGMDILWNGAFYAYGCEKDGSGRRDDIMFTGQLAGEMMSRYCGWGETTDFEHACSSIESQLRHTVTHSPDFYAYKVWDLVRKIDFGKGASECWPFYLESYTAMLALQCGYVEDGMKIIRHILHVYLRAGWIWAQNLWQPREAPYMTAPVSWFLTDVLTGASLDLREGTLTLGPILETGQKELRLPIFFPRFWAILEMRPQEGCAKLTITKVFGEVPGVLTRLRIRASGTPITAEVIYPVTSFPIREGAVLDLSAYLPQLTDCHRRDPLLPEKPTSYWNYAKTEALVTSRGTGLGLEIFAEGDLATPLATRTNAGLHCRWDAENPLVKSTSAQIHARWEGLLEPRYSQEYTFEVESEGDCRLWVDEQCLDAGSGEHSRRLKIGLNAGSRHAIRLEYEGLASRGYIRVMWRSTSQPKEILPLCQLYSKE